MAGDGNIIIVRNSIGNDFLPSKFLGNSQKFHNAIFYIFRKYDFTFEPD